MAALAMKPTIVSCRLLQAAFCRKAHHVLSTIGRAVSYCVLLRTGPPLLSFCADSGICCFQQDFLLIDDAFNIHLQFKIHLQVITAQYFVWFFCLLPLILPWSNMKLKWEGLSCIFLWMGAQTHWLIWGYLLEFKGKNVFVQLWLASLSFLAVNTWLLILIIHHHRLSPIFVPFENKVPKNSRKLK
ncbi:hypothetical protein HHK36_001483 [Tetracentron sinense]|uniref:GPI mannosyltransferase 1 n=1 Tax=Tetracentron sinense TaxID=13715 RepID=A0A835A2U4_TETSI|nr:hypothetical protein HHK36_001483 [Tetracentron sinense]